MRFSDLDLKSKLDKTFFMVEASRFERHTLWSEFSKHHIWHDINAGDVLTIGTLYSRPIVMTFTWAFIDDQCVCFYDCCSQLVDWKMVEDWIKENFHKTKAKTDAANFHICLHTIRDFTIVKE